MATKAPLQGARSLTDPVYTISHVLASLPVSTCIPGAIECHVHTSRQKAPTFWHAGGDVEVASIKEGALRVYSGQRLFPLTFQMPESGLALKERRWHASRRGGDVSLGSIAATDLEVYTCGALALPHDVRLPACHVAFGAALVYYLLKPQSACVYVASNPCPFRVCSVILLVRCGALRQDATCP